MWVVLESGCTESPVGMPYTKLTMFFSHYTTLLRTFWLIRPGRHADSISGCYPYLGARGIEKPR